MLTLSNKITKETTACFYTIRNKNNLQATITNYGARWVNMIVPGKDGKPVNVVLGFNYVEMYKNPSAVYYGAIIGRYANRIAKGQFSTNNISYQLSINNGGNHLHGGSYGLHAVVWEVVTINKNSIELTCLSKDGEEGYPGNMKLTVCYTLTDDNRLMIDFSAVTDKPGIINLAAHPYFNLNGAGSGTVLNHQLRINADSYTPINEEAIPTGEIIPVLDSPFDFTTAKQIGAAINSDDKQLVYGKGYDHNFVLNKRNDELSFAAMLTGDITGIKMSIFTTEPGLQLYSGNFMDGSNTGPEGYKDEYRTAVCLETQHFPDSPNQPHFPSVVLLPGEEYESKTIYQFS